MVNNQSLRRIVVTASVVLAWFSPTVTVAQSDTSESRQSTRSRSQQSEPDVQSLQAENHRLREELEALKVAVTKLQNEIEALGVLNITPGTTVEYGSVLFESGRREHIKKITFFNVYKDPPIVIVCESGTAGTWVMVKSQRITTNHAEIAVQGKFHYECRVAYLVIGEAADAAAKPRRTARQPRPLRPHDKRPVSKQEHLTWREYVQDCGVKAQQSNQAKSQEVYRTKYEGKQVAWEGTVENVREGFLGSSYLVSIKMQPRDSLGTDITLSVPPHLRDIALSLRNGYVVRFEGRIIQQGGFLLNHQVDVSSIEVKRTR